MAKVDPKTVNIWTARVIPVVLVGVVGYATYVHVVRLCADYLLRDREPRSSGTATALLAVYFVLALPMAASYMRVLGVVLVDPGFVALGQPRAAAGHDDDDEDRSKRRRRRRRSHDPGGVRLEEGVGARRYETRPSRKNVVNWHTSADSPGLEGFYSRDVFVCEMDGRPKWCTECRCWKPDRTHHCSDVGRCVRKMDHFCPWVGGVVGENSFKFFVQFVFYTANYCFFLLAVMTYYLHEQLNTPSITYDPHFAAIIGLATFFGLFTFGMTCSSGHFVMRNLTTIENLNKKTKAWQLAVYIPDRQKVPTMAVTGTPLPTVTYPLSLTSQKSSASPAPSDITNTETADSENNITDLPHHAERDARAQRTFAILRMEPGRSPWDLGVIGNWKSVMGNNPLDWLLPIRRSPLCNHESAISQFKLGKHFDKLMADNGLVSATDARGTTPSSGRRKSRRHSHRSSASKQDLEMQKYSQTPP